ncbi:EF-hand domain-containing protein [Desulfovibrio sp. UCD-KL4C]|uniref:EF-hand domain-containing protein n=1 Tax=Desulfovibrio sp. UCD-KL4C TaxID=2578120 RepID=UPI0025C20DC7|nr:EF-hand domain-containing protein [Desulfovibrio sp. UCD-KL4C]
MSISGVDSSMIAGSNSDIIAQMRGSNKGNIAEEFVSSMVADNDGDGDGLLSLKESGMSSDLFNLIDTDGDGQASQEELLADLENKQEQKGMMGELSVYMQGGANSGMSLTESIMSSMDSDGDNLLSQEETGLNDELFSALDVDGDGSISGEELNAAMTPPDATEQSTAATAASSASSGSEISASSSTTDEDDEETYDAYDLNQDGVVTADELMQAFNNGDESLADVVGKSSKVDGQSGQSPLTRMAMKAYQGQSDGTGMNPLGVVA